MHIKYLGVVDQGNMGSEGMLMANLEWEKIKWTMHSGLKPYMTQTSVDFKTIKGTKC